MYCIYNPDKKNQIQRYAEINQQQVITILENYYKIPVIGHNLFRFDFFFLVKGLRASVWKTRDICIGGGNPTNINFASIGNQVQFINTIKYFEQSLGDLLTV